VSILAKHYGVPFYIAAPSSTFDLAITSGEQIPIEQRSEQEVKTLQDLAIAPDEIAAHNPAFDVTPAENITAIITEKGVIKNPSLEKIHQHLM
jgi:methylthioribose-1-phosphate isomerase